MQGKGEQAAVPGLCLPGDASRECQVASVCRSLRRESLARTALSRGRGWPTAETERGAAQAAALALLVEVGLADGDPQAVPGFAAGVHAARRLDDGADGQVAVLHAVEGGREQRGEGSWGEEARVLQGEGNGGRPAAADASFNLSPRLTWVFTSPMVTPVKPANAACTALCASTCRIGWVSRRACVWCEVAVRRAANPQAGQQHTMAGTPEQQQQQQQPHIAVDAVPTPTNQS